MSLTLTELTTDSGASVHNEVIWAALSTKPNTPLTYPNHKYVLDVYIDGVMVQRMKATPQPDTKIGVFDIGPVLRNYISCQLSPSGDFLCQTLPEGQFVLDVEVKAGEEYGFTVYPDIELGSATYFNTYNEAQFNNVEGPLTQLRNLVASIRPKLSTVRMAETRYLIPFFSVDLSDVNITRRLYAKTTRALVNTQTVSTAVTNPHMCVFNAAPASVNAYFATNIDPALHWGYSLQFGDSVEYFFELTCEHIHTPYLIHFLNQFGGYETAEFRKRSRITTDITRKTYGQKNYEVNLRSGEAVIRYVTNNVLISPRPTYASTFADKLRVSTDILTDEHYRWLRQLVVSTDVYLDKGDGLIIPVSITNTNYEERKYVNDKFTALSLDLEFGNTLNAQYR